MTTSTTMTAVLAVEERPRLVRFDALDDSAVLVLDATSDEIDVDVEADWADVTISVDVTAAAPDTAFEADPETEFVVVDRAVAVVEDGTLRWQYESKTLRAELAVRLSAAWQALSTAVEMILAK